MCRSFIEIAVVVIGRGRQNPQGRGVGVERVGVGVGKFLPLTLKGRDLICTISLHRLKISTMSVESMNN